MDPKIEEGTDGRKKSKKKKKKKKKIFILFFQMFKDLPTLSLKF